tara:strand:+ start:2013 stop:2237 length:225 start_codon:yes stop_codon:yes gene_type:complete
MLLPNGSTIKNDVIEAFNVAVTNPENINTSGGVHWDFVDADLNCDLGMFYSSNYLNDCIKVLADNYDNYFGKAS